MPRSTRAVALCALLALLLAVSASAAVVSDGCVCSDVRPRVGKGATHAERFAPAATCREIHAKGQCDEKWMLDTVKELEGDGYCMITCGRCKCCAPVAPTLRAAGLGAALLDAAKGTPYETLFNDPAFEATVLVGGAGPVRDVGAQVLPPVEKWGNATWTAELLGADPDGQLLVGPGGVHVRATLQACKASVLVVDKPASA